MKDNKYKLEIKDKDKENSINGDFVNEKIRDIRFMHL